MEDPYPPGADRSGITVQSCIELRARARLSHSTEVEKLRNTVLRDESGPRKEIGIESALKPRKEIGSETRRLYFSVYT